MPRGVAALPPWLPRADEAPYAVVAMGWVLQEHTKNTEGKYCYCGGGATAARAATPWAALRR